MSEGNQNAFLPLMLLAIAVIGWSGFQTTQLVIERGKLREAISGQEAQVDQSARLRERMDSLAGRIARLAKGGNANATIIIEELRKRGITLSDQPPPAAGTAPAGEAAPQR